MQARDRRDKAEAQSIAWGTATLLQSVKALEYMLVRTAGGSMKDVVVIGAGKIGATVSGLLASRSRTVVIAAAVGRTNSACTLFTRCYRST